MANFSVAARTLIHLGAELITSDEVALNELIKNAFDAESPRARVDFHIGMSQERLDAFLELVRARRDTPWSPEILAEIVETLTHEGDSEGGDRARVDELIAQINATSSWAQLQAILKILNMIVVADQGSGMSAGELEAVFLQIGTASRKDMQASAQLHRAILGNKGIGRLAMMRLGDQARVTSWTSPELAHRIDFDWREFDTVDQPLESIPLQIVPATPLHSGTSGTVIEITALRSAWTHKRVEKEFVGRFLRRLQNPFEDMTQQSLFPIDVHYNGGQRMPIEGMKSLLSEHAQADLELEFTPDVTNGADPVIKTTLVDHQRGIDPQVVLRTRDEVTNRVEASAEDLKTIGPFTARLRWFNRDVLRTQTKLHGTTSEARTELDLWSGGVAIYRDGFRVGFSGQSSGEDWLGIDSSALKRGGFAVNRIQTVGALEISRAGNPNLIDRSNREGLLDTRQTQIVRSILFDFAIEELRRHITHEGTEAKRAQLEEVAKSAPETIRNSVLQVEQGIAGIRAQLPAEASRVVQSIANHLHFIKAETKRFEEAVRQAGERREDILELAGVGTVMSGVLHELTRTTAHTRQLMQKLAKNESPATRALLQKLDGEIKAINTRLRQLDPLSPSGRHRRELFDLVGLLQIILNGYEARFERHRIHPFLTMSGQDELMPFNINMVRGFVSLAVENLITNSVYWLQRGLKAGATQREIHLDLDPVSRTLTIWDNGPGISSADKDRVFTAGFTLRPRGQGLGLFLAAEVASYHKARLVLDSPDDDGRYRAFVLQLPQE
ncbi:MAG: sensor histidine kinase [Lysobacterales bacterium]